MDRRILLLALFSLLLVSADSRFRALDRELADVYYQKALEVDDPLAKESFLRTSLVFREDRADVWYRLGVLHDGKPRQAESYLRTALDLGLPADLEEDAQYSLARHAFRLKQYDTAWNLVSGMEDARGLQLATEVALMRGDTAAAKALARRGFSRYPGESFFLLTRVRLDDELAASILKGLLEGDRRYATPDLVRFYLLSETNPLVTSDLLALYDEVAGEPSFEQAMAEMRQQTRISYSFIDDIIDRFPLLDLNQYRTLADRLPSDDLRSFLESRILQSPGRLSYDENGDGYYEMALFFEDGKWSLVTYDGDQDGENDWMVKFTDSRPVSVEWTKEGVKHRVEYGYYPSAQSFETEGLELVTFGGAGYPLPLVEMPSSIFTAVPRLHLGSGTEMFPEDAVLERNVLGTSPRAVRLLSGGRTLTEGPDFRRVSVAGKVTTGERDLDGDGRFELREIWEEGKLTGYTEDRDGDGLPEYAELLADPIRRMWDLTGDGVFDVIRSGQFDRLYASALDGQFDIALRLSADGRVLRVVMGEKQYIPVEDHRGRWWLGVDSAPRVQADLPTFFIYRDQRFRVFKLEEYTFVERLP